MIQGNREDTVIKITAIEAIKESRQFFRDAECQAAQELFIQELCKKLEIDHWLTKSLDGRKNDYDILQK